VEVLFSRSLERLGREEQMSRRPRRNHAAAFKAKVALAAIKSEKTCMKAPLVKRSFVFAFRAFDDI
jgi:hypothetical protein